MFDLKWIREAPDAFDEGLKRRGLEPLAEKVIALDADHRSALTELHEMPDRRSNRLTSKTVDPSFRSQGTSMECEALDLRSRVSATLRPRMTRRVVGLEPPCPGFCPGYPHSV